MAIAFDASNSAQTTSAANLTTPAWTCAGSDRILIAAMGWSAQTVPNYSVMKWGGSGGTPLTQIGSTVVSTDWKCAIAYLINPATGSNTLYGELTGVTDEFCVGGSTWTGVSQDIPLGTPNNATGTSATPSVNVSSASNDVVIDMMYCCSPAAITKDVSQTLIWKQENIGTYCGGGQSYEAGAPTVTMSWSITSSLWIIIGVSIHPVGYTPPGGGYSDDRFRFRPSGRSSYTSTRIIYSPCWPMDAFYYGYDSLAENQSRMF